MATVRTAIHRDGRTSTEVELGLVEPRWWKEKPAEVPRLVFSTVKTIRDEQQARATRNDRYARLYENVSTGSVVDGKPIITSDRRGRLTLNIVRSCITTAAAKLAGSKPRPLFLTTRGNWEMQKKAQRLTQYCDGMFNEASIYDAGPQVFIDACVFGTGALRIFVDGIEPAEGKKDARRVMTERALISEIVVDDREAIYGKPQQLHQVRRIAKDVLLAMYGTSGSKVEAIRVTEPVIIERRFSGGEVRERMLEVVESWHLPSIPGAEDGRHTISINHEDGLLVDEPWTKPYFPFVFFRWTDSLEGFWGMGLAEELLGIQTEITRLLRSIKAAQEVACVPRVFVSEEANINKNHVRDAPGGIVTYRGTQPPIIGPAAAMPSEIYQHLERLIQKGYEITGISQSDAAARKPAGVESAVAIREVNDIASSRFLLQGQRYERFYIDAARIMIDMSRDLFADNDALKVKAAGRRGKFIESIPWKEVDLDEDQYVMQVFPVSQMPNTPAGRIQMVTELREMASQSGKPLISDAQTVRLLNFPDIDETVDLATAQIECAQMLVDAMLDGGEYTPPEKYMDPETCVAYAQSAVLRARQEGASEEAIENVYRFMEEAAQMGAPAPAPPEPPPPEALPPEMAAAAPPMGPEMMPPGLPPLPPEANGAPLPMIPPTA